MLIPHTYHILFKDDWPVHVFLDAATAKRKKEEYEAAALEKQQLRGVGKLPYFQIIESQGDRYEHVRPQAQAEDYSL
jgi:hypothetical protein